MPQHYTQHTGSVTFHWRIYKYKNHAWHIVLSPQTFGRGERGKKAPYHVPRTLKLSLKHIFPRLTPSHNVMTLTGPSDMSHLPSKTIFLNPYPTKVGNMLSARKCQMGFNSAFEVLTQL